MRVLGSGYVTCRPPLWALSEGSVITLTGSIEEELCVGVLARQRLLVVGCIREQRCLVSVVDLRVAHFHAVVDAELGGHGAIESCFDLAMTHVRTKILERGRNAFFGRFESTIVGKRCLMLDRNLGSVCHL
jgi:hypothetical protein